MHCYLARPFWEQEERDFKNTHKKSLNGALRRCALELRLQGHYLHEFAALMNKQSTSKETLLVPF